LWQTLEKFCTVFQMFRRWPTRKDRVRGLIASGKAMLGLPFHVSTNKCCRVRGRPLGYKTGNRTKQLLRRPSNLKACVPRASSFALCPAPRLFASSAASGGRRSRSRSGPAASLVERIPAADTAWEISRDVGRRLLRSKPPGAPLCISPRNWSPYAATNVIGCSCRYGGDREAKVKLREVGPALARQQYRESPISWLPEIPHDPPRPPDRFGSHFLVHSVRLLAKLVEKFFVSVGNVALELPVRRRLPPHRFGAPLRHARQFCLVHRVSGWLRRETARLLRMPPEGQEAQKDTPGCHRADHICCRPSESEVPELRRT